MTPHSGERKKGVLKPDFNWPIKVDFQGTTLSSDTGFLLLREIDEREIALDNVSQALRFN